MGQELLPGLVAGARRAEVDAALPVEARILAVVARGPVPWALLAHRVGAPYAEVYGAASRLLAARRVRVLPGSELALRPVRRP